jgi:hypothetical protein
LGFRYCGGGGLNYRIWSKDGNWLLRLSRKSQLMERLLGVALQI